MKTIFELKEEAHFELINQLETRIKEEMVIGENHVAFNEKIMTERLKVYLETRGFKIELPNKSHIYGYICWE